MISQLYGIKRADELAYQMGEGKIDFSVKRQSPIEYLKEQDIKENRELCSGISASQVQKRGVGGSLLRARDASGCRGLAAARQCILQQQVCVCVTEWGGFLPISSRPLRGAIPQTAPSPKLCPNVAFINPTHHQKCRGRRGGGEKEERD